MRIETNLFGVGIVFVGGVALGYTIARAKFIELMYKASLESAINDREGKKNKD